MLKILLTCSEAQTQNHSYILRHNAEGSEAQQWDDLNPFGVCLTVSCGRSVGALCVFVLLN
jgi:hypothetical protein